MSEYRDQPDAPEQSTRADEPIAPTRREQRDRAQAQDQDAATARDRQQDAVDPLPGREDAAASEYVADARQARQDAEVDPAPAAETSSVAGSAIRQDSATEEMPEPAEHSATTDHDAIRTWAEDRHATPATLESDRQDGDVGELRLDFDFGNDLEDLAAVSWDDWFRAFDERGLEFVFQTTTRPDGSASNDFRLEPAGTTRT